MNHTRDLKQALELLAGPEQPGRDPAEDLARARAAARSRVWRRIRFGLTGLTTASVIALMGGHGALSHDPGQDSATSSHAGSHRSGPVNRVTLVSATFDAAPYTFDLTPRGWAVQGQNAFAVTIAPTDGSVSTDPDDYVGKLVVMFDHNPPSGRETERGARSYWISGDSGYTTLATHTRHGEPRGVVRIQYPQDAGWDESTMLTFLAHVHVGPGALPGRG